MPTQPDYVVRVCRYQADGFVGAGCHSLGMPRTSSPDGLADLLEQQSSVVSRAQLLALGMKDNAMQYRVRRGGPWQTLLPGVYLTVSGVPSFSQKEMAALLYAGPVRGSAAFRSVLAEVADGIRSTAEGDLRDVVRTARLPMPLFNPSLYDGDLFLGKPDGWWPGGGGRDLERGVSLRRGRGPFLLRLAGGRR